MSHPTISVIKIWWLEVVSPSSLLLGRRALQRALRIGNPVIATRGDLALDVIIFTVMSGRLIMMGVTT